MIIKGLLFQKKQRLMLTSLEEIHQEPTPNAPPIQATYQKVEAQLQVHQYFSVLLKQEPYKIHSQKLILPKMRTKLYSWLEKLALQTFNFSQETLLTAGLIIDQYLDKTNQSPSTLQLIGCAGLFLASKIREEIIVDPECYSTASCNVFSKRQLLQRERALYQHVDWKRLKNGVISGVRIGCTLLGMKDHLERCEQMLWNCLKDEELMGWREVKIVYGVLSMASIDPLKELAVKDCLNLIKLI